MLKDGTCYLCLVQFANDEIQWSVLHWGQPCGLSSNGSECWINDAAFALKIKALLATYELPKATETTPPLSVKENKP